MKLTEGIFSALACGALAIGCGGGGHGTSPPIAPEPAPAKSACASMADHVADTLVGAGADGLGEQHRESLVRVMVERCETDAWSDEAVACLAQATANEGDDSFQRCGEMLTDAQQDAAEEQLNREVMDRRSAPRTIEAPMNAPTGGGAPPPPAPPPPDDPCGGGA